ncbi:MAG: DNA gyrase C-terminal beta-propeller domain-containing protein, partial [Verrucomicrobiia bacterium]
ITSVGQAVRCPVDNVRETSRGSKGVKLVNLSGKDKLTAISEVIELDEGEQSEGEEQVDSEEILNEEIPPPLNNQEIPEDESSE